VIPPRTGGPTSWSSWRASRGFFSKSSARSSTAAATAARRLRAAAANRAAALGAEGAGSVGGRAGHVRKSPGDDPDGAVGGGGFAERGEPRARSAFITCRRLRPQALGFRPQASDPDPDARGLRPEALPSFPGTLLQSTNSFRSVGWHLGQKQASPSPTRTARILVPQRGQGLPSRKKTAHRQEVAHLLRSNRRGRGGRISSTAWRSTDGKSRRKSASASPGSACGRRSWGGCPRRRGSRRRRRSRSTRARACPSRTCASGRAACAGIAPNASRVNPHPSPSTSAGRAGRKKTGNLRLVGGARAT